MKIASLTIVNSPPPPPPPQRGNKKRQKKITISSLNDPAELKKTVELLLLPNVKMKKKTFNFKKNNIIFLFFTLNENNYK